MYTKFTHSIAGLLAVLTGFYAVSQSFRDWVAALAALYAVHVPTIFQPLPALGLALYMWYRNGQTDPNQPKTPPPPIVTSMLCIALVLSTFLFTGCTYSQAEVVAGVQKVEVGLKTVKAVLPSASVIAQELAQAGDSEAAEYVTAFVQIANPAVDKLIAVSDDYIANPGNDSFQAILNALDAFTNQVDQQALTLAGLKNPQSQQKAVAWIALVSTGAHVTLAILENYATSKQKKAVPTVSAHVRFDQIKPFLQRDYAREELAAMGYSNPDQLLAYAGL